MAEIYEKIAEKLMHHIAESVYTEGIESIDFKAVVADIDGIWKPIITKSTDFNEGAVSNELEWARQYGLQLRQELNLYNSTGDRLNFFGETFGIPRQTAESDDSYKTRMIGKLRAAKITKWAIIDAIQPYFSQPVRIVEARDAGFFGRSYFSYDKELLPPATVKPAIFKSGTGANYYFEVWIPRGALNGIDPKVFGFFNNAFLGNHFFSRKGQTGLNWLLIRDLIDNTKIAGVRYNIFIVDEV